MILIVCVCVCVCVSVHHSLDMDVVSGCHDDHIGDKVVLHSGVDLDDVTPLTPHVEVVNGGILQILWSLANGKSMRPATRTSVSLLLQTAKVSTYMYNVHVHVHVHVA